MRPRDPFTGLVDLPRTTARTDPNPPWTTSKWDEVEDRPFRDIRRAAEAIEAKTPGLDPKSYWVREAANAYHVWHDDHRDPEKLYRAALYLTFARRHGQDLERFSDYSKAVGQINMGWSIIRNVPRSYEYARLGYICNAGDFDHHKYGNLGRNLMLRDPNDLAVALAMVGEYSDRKPEPEFESFMFDSLKRLSKSKLWKPWDYQRLGHAYRLYGRQHKDKSAYAKAIELAKTAKDLTHPGWDTTWIDIYIAATVTEMKDPNFGILPGGKPIWAADP